LILTKKCNKYTILLKANLHYMNFSKIWKKKKTNLRDCQLKKEMSHH